MAGRKPGTRIVFRGHLRDMDEELGRMSGMFRYAEGWRRHLHLGFCGPEDDPLRESIEGPRSVAK